jgi:hypothetical protein
LYSAAGQHTIFAIAVSVKLCGPAEHIREVGDIAVIHEVEILLDRIDQLIDRIHAEPGRYHCEGALVNHGTARCISFGGLRTDIAVGREVLRLLKPLGIAAAAKALEARMHETSAAQKQLELALAQPQFAANMMPSIPPTAWQASDKPAPFQTLGSRAALPSAINHEP